MRNLLPALPLPSFALGGLWQNKQQFQIGDMVNYSYVGWERFRVEGIRRYKCFGIIWAIRYKIQWYHGAYKANTKPKNVSQWRLLYNRRRYNKQRGIKKAKTIKNKCRWGVETEGLW